MGAIHIDQNTFTVPVIGAESSEAIGKLLTVLFHKSDLSLAYLVIDTQKSDTEEETQLFISFEDILSLNAYSIVVKMNEGSPEQIIGSFSQGEYIQLIGAKIYSERGLPLGKLEAVTVDARSGGLQTISIADKDKRETLDRERIVSVGTSNIVTVREDISVPVQAGEEEQEEPPYQTSSIGILPLKEIESGPVTEAPADEPMLQPEPAPEGGKPSQQPAAPASFPTEGIRLTTSELLQLIATLSNRQPENPKNESMELLMRKLSKIERLLTDFVTRKNGDESVSKITADFHPKTARDPETVPPKAPPHAELFTLKHPMETKQDPQTAFDTKIHLSGDSGESGEPVKSDSRQYEANGPSATASFGSAGTPPWASPPPDPAHTAAPPVSPAIPPQKTVTASGKESSAFWKSSGQQIFAMCLFAGAYAAMCMFQIF